MIADWFMNLKVVDWLLARLERWTGAFLQWGER